MSDKLDLRIDLASRQTRKLCSIKDHNLAFDTHGGDDVLLLRHVSCFVDLAVMVDFLNNGEFWRAERFAGIVTTTNLLTFGVVIFGRRRELWKTEFSDSKVIWGGI